MTQATETLDTLLRHPLLSRDAKDACEAISAVKARKVPELVQYLGLTRAPVDFLAKIDQSDLVISSLTEAKASLLKEKQRLERILRASGPAKSQSGDSAIKSLLDVVKTYTKTCNTTFNQLRGRITTQCQDKRCTATAFEQPHEWVRTEGHRLLRGNRSKSRMHPQRLQACVRTLVDVFSVAPTHLTAAVLETAISSATELMKLAVDLSLDYCFLQLELCRMMCQLLVSAMKKTPVPETGKLRNYLWDPANIPQLYPQLRFHDNHMSARVYSLFGFLFDNPRECDLPPGEDRVAQMAKKAVPHKHQPHHFLPVTEMWAREDGYNPARKLLVEVMVFFWLGVYPGCSYDSRLVRDDDLLHLYSTRANKRFVDMTRVIGELKLVSGLHAVKEYLNYLLRFSSPNSSPVMCALSSSWADYDSGVSDACEKLRAARLGHAKDKEEQALRQMLVARSQMTAVGASVRVPGSFLTYVNRLLKTGWGENVLDADSKTPDIDRAVRSILDAPDISFCKQVTGYVFFDEYVDQMAKSDSFCVRVGSDVLDFRKRDRRCMLRLLAVLCVWFQIAYTDYLSLRYIVNVYYSGDRGASSFPVHFHQTFKDNPRLKHVVAAMGFTWVNLTAVTYTRLPRNLNACTREAMVSRSRSLVGDDTLAHLDKAWLVLYCGICNCSHALGNWYPKIGGAPIEGYHGHTDIGFGRGIRVNLSQGAADCDRTGSRIAFQCIQAHCLAVSMRNCCVNWSRVRGFICSCCGIFATWCPTLGSFWKRGYLCSRCSVIAPSRLESIADGTRIARGGPNGSLRVKESKKTRSRKEPKG